MMSAAKVLVIGGASLVGRHLVDRLGRERAVVTFHSAAIDGGIHYDALTMDPEILADAAAGCSHAVLLLANARPEDCARHPLASRRLNVDALAVLLEKLVRWRIVPVFASTEAVFDGRRGDYRETDRVGPLMTYAAQKVEIEHRLQSGHGPWLILRLARVVTGNPTDDTLFAQWLRDIKGNLDIRCAADHVFSPIHADDVATAAVTLMDGGHTGLFHVAGPDRLDRLSMLRLLIKQWREAGGDYTGTVTPCRMADFPTLEPRPADISMCSEKLTLATGVRPRGIEVICQELIAASQRQGDR